MSNKILKQGCTALRFFNLMIRVLEKCHAILKEIGSSADTDLTEGIYSHRDQKELYGYNTHADYKYSIAGIVNSTESVKNGSTESEQVKGRNLANAISEYNNLVRSGKAYQKPIQKLSRIDIKLCMLFLGIEDPSWAAFEERYGLQEILHPLLFLKKHFSDNRNEKTAENRERGIAVELVGTKWKMLSYSIHPNDASDRSIIQATMQFRDEGSVFVSLINPPTGDYYDYQGYVTFSRSKKIVLQLEEKKSPNKQISIAFNIDFNKSRTTDKNQEAILLGVALSYKKIPPNFEEETVVAYRVVLVKILNESESVSEKVELQSKKIDSRIIEYLSQEPTYIGVPKGIFSVENLL